jgi:phospholipid/cholesterol/gamma-HCH transport system substrate-binding protein
MNNAQMSARVGLFFILGCALLWITYESLHGGSFSRKPGYTVVTRFDTIKGLKPGDDVRQAGVRIGTVEATRLSDSQAEAVLRLDDDINVAKDATASIAMSGLLGGQFVSLDFGHPSSGYVAPGQELPTRETPDLNSILADLGGLTSDIKNAVSGISGMAGATSGQGGILQKVDKLVTENSAGLTRTVSHLEAITGELRAGKGTLGKLINDPTAHDELVAALTEIRAAAVEAKAFVANTQGVIEQVKSGKGAVGALIYDEATAENLRKSIANFQTLSSKLADGQGTLGKLMTDDQLYKDVQSVVRKADRTLDSMSDQGPITAVGVAANALF